MRRKLPDTALQFIEMLRSDRPALMQEIFSALSGNYQIRPELLASWLPRKGCHVFIMVEVAKAHGLHDREARDAFMALPEADRKAIDDAIKAEIAEFNANSET